jgi:predicted dehydrogenase
MHKHYPDWRNYVEYSGGMMTDWGAHHFDIAQWGLGMDQSGPTEIIPPENPKATSGLRYLYAGGVEVIHANGQGASRGIRFVGPDGEVNVDRGFITSKPAEIIKTPLGEKDVHLYRSPGHYREFLNCVRSRRDPNCQVEVGARSVTVCHLGNLAYLHHRRLRWDPKAWRFVGNDGDNKWLDRDRREPYRLPAV